MLHVGKQERIYVLDRYYIVYIALFDPERSFCIRYFRGAGGDKDDPDLLWFQSGFLHCLSPCDLCCHFHRRLDGQKTGNESGKLYPDQPDHRRTGRTDKRSLIHVLFDI